MKLLNISGSRGPVLKTVQQQLLGERGFSSNAIEGNVLTLRQTVLILQTEPPLLTRERDCLETDSVMQTIALHLLGRLGRRVIRAVGAGPTALPLLPMLRRN